MARSAKTIRIDRELGELLDRIVAIKQEIYRVAMQYIGPQQNAQVAEILQAAKADTEKFIRQLSAVLTFVKGNER